MESIRIRLLRPTIINTDDGRVEGKIGEEFVLSRYLAALLCGDGAAERVTHEREPYTVTTLTPEHGDPAPRKVSSSPPTRVTKKD